MSWFLFQDIKKKKNMVGVWLRVRSNDDLVTLIKKSGLLPRTNQIEWIEVNEILPDNQARLQVWSKSLSDCIRGKPRHTVFYVLSPINPGWCCEGDLGKGLIEG